MYHACNSQHCLFLYLYFCSDCLTSEEPFIPSAESMPAALLLNSHVESIKLATKRAEEQNTPSGSNRDKQRFKCLTLNWFDIEFQPFSI